VLALGGPLLQGLSHQNPYLLDRGFAPSTPFNRSMMGRTRAGGAERRTSAHAAMRTPPFAYDAGVGEFVNVTLARVPQGFDFSEPLHRLFEWVET
jgi:hypothetical protein